MIDTLKDLRQPTLQSTYKEISKFIKENKLKKEYLSKFIDIESKCDAFDTSVKLIIADSAQLNNVFEYWIFSGDKSVIKCLVKCKWFFENVPNSFFITKVFPVVSVSTRLKVITALSKYVDRDRIEELYEFVRSQFGYLAAEPLLCRLPDNTILKTIEKTKRLGPRVFLKIAKVNPDLAMALVKGFKGYVPECVFKQLIRTRFDKVITLDDLLLQKFWFSIGRKLFRSTIAIRLNTLNPKCYKIVRKISHITRRVDDDSILAYFEIRYRVRSLSDWKKYVPSMLGDIVHLPLSRKEKLLHGTFQRMFLRDLWDSPEAWTTDTLEGVTPERRAACLRHRLCQGESYTYLKPPAEAIPLLITRVKRTEDGYKRIDILQQMIKSCRLLDSSKILTVCEFINEEQSYFKHNQDEVLNILLSNLPCSLLPTVLPTLTRISRQFISVYSDLSVLRPHEAYVGYLLTENQDATLAIKTWTDDLVTYLRCSNFGGEKVITEKNGSILLNTLYLHFKSILADIPEDKSQLFVTGFLNSAHDCNVDISLMPHVINAVNDKHLVLISGVCNFSDILGTKWNLILCTSGNFTELLKKDPSWMIDHIDDIIRNVVGYVWCYGMAGGLGPKRLLEFYQIKDKIALVCETLWRDDKYSPFRIAQIYCRVSSVEKYVGLVKSYLLTDPVIKERDKASTIRLITNYLRFLTPIEHTLPYVLPCLVGGSELLFPALPSFLAFCYNRPIEDVLNVALPYLSGKVSVMKKVVRILFDVCPSNKAIKYFIVAWNDSNHYSGRIVLLKCIAKIFVDTPTLSNWQIFEYCILQCDSAVFEALPDASDIPDEYLARFVESVWHTKSKFPETNASCLLNSIPMDRMPLLDDEFCQKLIKPVIFTDGDNLITFSVYYLLMKGKHETLDSRTEFILQILKERINNVRPITKFVSLLCDCVKNEKSIAALFFITKLKTYLESTCYLSPLLSLQYLEIFLNCGCCEDLSELPLIGKEIAQIWLLVPDYFLLRKILVQSFTQFFSDQVIVNGILVGMVGKGAVISLGILDILNILYTPERNFSAFVESPRENDIDSHQYIITALYKEPDPTIHMMVKSYLARLTK